MKHSFFGSYQYDNKTVCHFVVFGDTFKQVYDNICSELDTYFLDIPEGTSLPESDYSGWLYFGHRELNSTINLGYSIFIYKFVIGVSSSHIEGLVH